MSLGGSLQIGRTGLLASQAAIEVAGNNLANLATPGYHRQVATLAPLPSHQLREGLFVGRGVEVTRIARQINEALESRVRSGISDQAESAARQSVLSQIEAVQNEFSGIDLSTHLASFFNSFSQLANNPQDTALRTLVIQEGSTLSTFMNTLRGDLITLRTQVDEAIDAAALAADNLLTQIDTVNQKIVAAEAGLGGAHGLRDQRDLLLGELAQYIDISTVEGPTGMVDVFVGSIPLILNGQSRGIEVRRLSVNGQLQVDVVLSADGSPLNASSGEIGSLVIAREQEVNNAVKLVNQFAHDLIFEVNRLHSQGQGLRGHSSVTSTNRVLDTTLALNDTAAGLDFTPNHGSFHISVTQKSTGQRVTSAVSVDLDGITPAGDTTLTTLAADIDALANITATVSADGRLTIASGGSDFEVSFSDDTSGVLAALGINSFFTGTDAQDIDVNSVVSSTPSLVAAAQGHIPGDNSNALAITALRDTQLNSLNGLSLTEVWNRHVEDYAVRLSQAEQQLAADDVIRENLIAQQQQASGVNADEEAIDLLRYQRAYQGSARFLAIVDELLQTLIGLL